MLCCQHIFPWLSLTIRPYHLSLPVGLLNYTLCSYWVVVDKFLLVVEYLHNRRRTSRMSSSLLFQQCPRCLVHLVWMILEMGGRWPYNWCFVGCCFQDLFNIARSILVQFPSNFFSIHLISVHLVHPYSRIDMTAARKKLRFILSDKSDFHMIDNLSIAVHAFASRTLMWFLVYETLLPRYVNLSTNFKESPFGMEMSPFFKLKHMYSVLSAFTRRSIPPAVCPRLCNRDSAWVDVFARSSMSSA